MAEQGRRPSRRRRDPARDAPFPPTKPLRLPEPELREAYLVLDLALRAGEVLLYGGAGAADVAATATAIAHACGLQRVECDITFTSITLTYVRAADVAPVTRVRLVRQRALDYTRVTKVHALVDDLLEGRTDRAGAAERLDAIRTSPHPYRSWAVTLWRALLATAIVVLLSGGPVVAAAAFGSTVVVDRVVRRLTRRSVPAFYLNTVGATIATGVAVGLAAADVGVQPSLVVAGGIILLLPGTVLVGAVQDAITGYLVTASARAFETVILTAGIVTGVALALEIGLRFGVEVQVVGPTPLSLGQLPVQVLAAGVAAASFAAANYAPRRTLVGAGLAGALGWVVLLATREGGLSVTFSSGAAAVAVGFASYILAQVQRTPPLVYLAAGIIPLLPGLTIYRGMLRISEGDPLGGLVLLSGAATTGLALAAGAILGEFLAQPARREVERFERRLVGPRLAGPLRWRGRN